MLSSHEFLYTYVHVHVCRVVVVFPLIVAGKMDADLMDEKRKEHVAYEYLCHLEEAKK